MTDQNTAPLDLDGLLLRIGQEFDGELHLTEDEARALISQAREAERMRGVVDRAARILENEAVSEPLRVAGTLAMIDQALAPATGGGE